MSEIDENYEVILKMLQDEKDIYKEKNEKLKKENAALTNKVKTLEEYYVETAEQIRAYDREILELKAQCQKLTQNERLAYKKHNGNTADIPTEPIKIADWLIDKFFNTDCLINEIAEINKDCLRQIAEHLLVFCGRE